MNVAELIQALERNLCSTCTSNEQGPVKCAFVLSHDQGVELLHFLRGYEEAMQRATKDREKAVEEAAGLKAQVEKMSSTDENWWSST